jgi:hypothetical protein
MKNRKNISTDFLKIPRLLEVPDEILDAHPILKYRIKHFAEGVNVSLVLLFLFLLCL